MREYKNGDETIQVRDGMIRTSDKWYLFAGTNSDDFRYIEVDKDTIEVGPPIVIPERDGRDPNHDVFYVLDDIERVEYYPGYPQVPNCLAIARIPGTASWFPGDSYARLQPDEYYDSDVAWYNYENDYIYYDEEGTQVVPIGETPEFVYYRQYGGQQLYTKYKLVNTIVYDTEWKQIEPKPAEDPNLSLIVTSESIYNNNNLPLAEKATLILGDSDHHLYRHDSDKKRGYIPIDDEIPNLPLIYDDTNDTLSAVDVLNIKKLSAEELISQDFKVDENGVTRGNKQLIPIQSNPTNGGVVTYSNGEYKTSKDLSLTSINVVDRIVVEGISYLNGDVVADKNVTIAGDLIVNGTTYTTEEQSIDTNSDYIVLRHSNPSPLSNQEKSGMVVYNYRDNKSAAIAVDSDGIWRVSDNEIEHTTSHSNLSRFGNTFYEGLTTTIEVIQTGVTIARDADELSDCVYTDRYYYHDNRAWFELGLRDNRLWFDIDNPITDTDLIATLETLDKQNLIYYRSLTILEIDDESNQPILTREEADNLADGAPLVWGSENNRAITSSTDSGNQVLKSVMNEDGSISYEWGSSGSGSVWRGTREELDEALSITDPNNENYIPNNALLIVTDSEQTYLIGDTMEAE